MSTDAAALALGRTFHQALVSADWDGIRALLHDDATWTLPGDNTISGTADGADAVVERARLIASYGLSFELLHLLVSRENLASPAQHRAPGGRRAGRVPGHGLPTPRRKDREHRDLPLRRARHERLLRLRRVLRLRRKTRCPGAAHRGVGLCGVLTCPGTGAPAVGAASGPPPGTSSVGERGTSFFRCG
ncbi:nuclear transport factor 2 family protein [Streptomyces sp. M19]